MNRHLFTGLYRGWNVGIMIRSLAFSCSHLSPLEFRQVNISYHCSFPAEKTVEQGRCQGGSNRGEKETEETATKKRRGRETSHGNASELPLMVNKYLARGRHCWQNEEENLIKLTLHSGKEFVASSKNAFQRSMFVCKILEFI